MKHIQQVAAALLILVGASASARAHAVVDHAEPKVGSELALSPTLLKVWFSEAIEPAFSTLSVEDSAQKRVDGKDAHVDKDNRSLFIVSLPALSAGTYKVTWSVVASDTHRTRGDFTFTVKP